MFFMHIFFLYKFYSIKIKNAYKIHLIISGFGKCADSIRERIAVARKGSVKV